MALTHPGDGVSFLGTVFRNSNPPEPVGFNVPRHCCEMIRSPLMQWPVHAKSHGNGEGPCSSRVSQMWSHAMCTVSGRCFALTSLPRLSFKLKFLWTSFRSINACEKLGWTFRCHHRCMCGWNRYLAGVSDEHSEERPRLATVLIFAL